MKKEKLKLKLKSKSVVASAAAAGNRDSQSEDRLRKNKKAKGKQKLSRSELARKSELEEAGEEGESLIPKLTPDNREREAIELLCHKIVENFWTTAWEICAERFYHGNAPAMVALELRNTWLRIIESQWLDQDQAEDELPSNFFVPDEPPPPLNLESASTESILKSRIPVKEDAGGSGEPFASARSNKGKKGKSGRGHKPKTKLPLKGGGAKKSEGGALPPPSDSNSILPAKRDSKSKIPRLSYFTGAKNASGKKSSEKTVRDSVKSKDEGGAAKASDDSESKSQLFSESNTNAKKVDFVPLTVNGSVSLSGGPSRTSVSENPEQEDAAELDCVPLPPPPEPEVPWEVIFEAKHKFLDGAAVSPSISQEYRFLGLQPWTPSQCGGAQGGAFRYIYEPSAYGQSGWDANNPDKESRVMLKPPMMLLKPGDGEAAKGARSAEGAKATSESAQLERNTVGGSDTSNSMKIIERIDNASAADSDQVVDILKHSEVYGIQKQESQIFHLGDSEFSKHFDPPKEIKSIDKSTQASKPAVGSDDIGRMESSTKPHSKKSVLLERKMKTMGIKTRERGVPGSVGTIKKGWKRSTGKT